MKRFLKFSQESIQENLDESRDVKQPGPHPDMVKAKIKHTHKQSVFKRSKTYVTVDKKDFEKAKKVLGNQLASNGGNVYLEIEEAKVESTGDTYCSDECCGSDVKASDCTCPGDCPHCDCNTITENVQEEVPMMMRQLAFIKYAADEISKNLNLGEDPEEWYQNKLAVTHSMMATLYTYMDLDEYGEFNEMEEARRKGAPKMTGDSVAIQRAKDAEHNKAMGRTKTGRKKPVRTMTSTQRSLASLR